MTKFAINEHWISLKNKHSVINRFNKYTIIKNGCHEWIGYKQADGYGVLGVGGVSIHAHRISYLINVGPIPWQHCILHSCDNPGCVNPKHLRAGTQGENVKDMYLRNRRADFGGENNSRAILTREKVMLAREMRKNGYKFSELAKFFGVAQATIGHAVRGKTWKVV